MNRKIRVILAAVIAICMLMISYWVTGQRFGLSGETTLIRKLELVKGWFIPHLNPMADSVLLINVSYDPELASAYDSYGLPAGLEKITDRQKLAQLLAELKKKDDYKYIMLDILFSDDIHTDADSTLFDLIASMDRIVIPRDYDGKMADKRLYSKAGLANYFTNYKNVSFTKFPYIVDGQKSMPLVMYEAVTGRHIDNHGFYSTDGGRLVRESILLYFDLKCDRPYTDDGEKTWYNLGMDLLGSSYLYGNDSIQGTDELYSNPELTKGKYIVIGALSSGDSHFSYLENQPGSTIIFNAFLALLHGHHFVSIWVFLLLLVAYFILSYLILGQQTVNEALSESGENKNKIVSSAQSVFKVLASWIGYSMFLTILCIITYLWMGEVYDIFITATLFQLISMIVKRINKHKKAK